MKDNKTSLVKLCAMIPDTTIDLFRAAGSHTGQTIEAIWGPQQ